MRRTCRRIALEAVRLLSFWTAMALVPTNRADGKPMRGNNRDEERLKSWWRVLLPLPAGERE